MPSLSSLPSDLSRTKLLQALERCGFVVSMRGGNGSHCKATWPRSGKVAVIPYSAKLPKKRLQYVLEDIEAISGLSWEDVRKEL